jgi:hypothetical protein
MKTKNCKTGLVVGLLPEQYRIADPRLNRPVCHQQIEGGKITGSMLLQDLETASLERGKEITYFCPNKVAVLLSISSKSLGKAKDLYEKFFHSPSVEFRLEKVEEDKKTFLNLVSSTVCDYIEHVQTAVVFAYTALETFANLSIPEGYLYHIENESKGIRETYNKEAIERWLTLKIKLQHILGKIYRAKNVERQKWWGHFSNLERFRNDIIHQETINSTDFYKEYFKATLFQACECPLPIIKFFYEAQAENNRTNPLWPWLINEKNHFPISTRYDLNFEVIGNVYEGMKK